MSRQTTSPPPPPPPSHIGFATHPVHKTLASAANLANLLPTGTVLAFQTLTPSFSNNGTCQTSNKYLTASLTIFCSLICLLSSFTDSFIDCDGKLCYGIATFNGLYIFNATNINTTTHPQELDSGTEELDDVSNVSGTNLDLSKFRIKLIDCVHALVSLLVFLVFAFCDSDLQKCYFPSGGEELDVLVMNLPLAAGVFSSFLFMIFPTTRRGVGYSDMQYANSK
ncbi:hypothetical protein ACS0TY_002202 [Phlomoides rotata]